MKSFLMLFVCIFVFTANVFAAPPQIFEILGKSRIFEYAHHGSPSSMFFVLSKDRTFEQANAQIERLCFALKGEPELQYNPNGIASPAIGNMIFFQNVKVFGTIGCLVLDKEGDKTILFKGASFTFDSPQTSDNILKLPLQSKGIGIYFSNPQPVDYSHNFLHKGTYPPPEEFNMQFNNPDIVYRKAQRPDKPSEKDISIQKSLEQSPESLKMDIMKKHNIKPKQ